ncbi:hypothetical protein BKA70DRAFT_862664 [Coprinopsis sp. MPI-PUGE-AT-0042]|nr:hypothetical protein BKA70DRAFT_862664 [Coprinopsis sp. MPI-PUGE-AT-0042]
MSSGYFSKAKDMGTLQAASPVSSVFRKACQEEIFFKINIYGYYSVNKSDTHHLPGLGIFRRNRTLLSYLRIVSIQHSQDGFALPDEPPTDSIMAELAQLIATPFVQKFSFLRWEGQMAPEFQRGILALVRSPQLTTLSLTYAPVRLANMVESPHLGHLVLRLAGAYDRSKLQEQLFLEPFPQLRRSKGI